MVDYKNTSAADDYLDDEDLLDEDEDIEGLAVDDEQDLWAEGESDAQWLDQLRYTPRRGGINDIWKAYGSSYQWESQDAVTKQAVRVASALKVAQGFVDTFALGDLRYRVTFDAHVQTAGTDFDARQVVISHKPLFDKTLNEEQANTVITSMACHESDHVTFGRDTAKAVTEAYRGQPNEKLANRISNILDDVRIERRHVERYPGHAGLYEPALDYVATTQLREANLTALDGKNLRGGNLVVAGARYTAYVDWTGAEAERDYWLDWRERGTADDSIATHLAAVAEALTHVSEMDPPEPPKGKPQGEGEGEGGEDDDEQESEGGQGGEPVEAENPFPDCFVDGADDAAEANGLRRGGDKRSDEVQELVEKAKTLQSDGLGGYGEVYWSARGLTHDQKATVTSDNTAAAAIKAAFNRSRTGHYNVSRNCKSGRLDNRSLPRLALDDYRLFSQRKAQSEGKYLVWLLVDVSGSMTGGPVHHAAQVAHALAAATRSMPNISLDVWGWTSGFRGVGTFGAARVYTEGDALSNIGYIERLSMGSTPDAEVVAWAGRAIRKAAKPGQTPVLIIASDGGGDLSYKQHVVPTIREKGVQVVSVAIGNLSETYQRAIYGEGNYLAWKGSIQKMAKPLGELIARVAKGQAA